MTKKLRLFLTMLFLTLLGGVNTAWADEVTISVGSSSLTWTADGDNYVASSDEFSLEYQKGTYTNSISGGIQSAELRLYSGTNFVISSSYTITNIVYNVADGTGKNYSVSALSTEDGNLVDGVWKGSANSVTASLSAQNRIKSVTITYTSSGPVVQTVATPTFSPEGGTFTSAQNVTISCETSGATIYYTIDGTTPTTSSSVYSSAIPVSQTTTIKAFAAASGYNNSIVASATYAIVEHAGTQEDPYSVADARDAIDAGVGLTGVYATGIVTEIPTEWSTKYNNITFNFIDEGGSDFLQAYRCVSTDNADASEVAVGDIVVVKGNLKKYNSTYEFDAACELVSLTHSTSTDPVINADDVTIAYDATSGEITYTIDNPVDGTNLTVSEDADWISEAAVDATNNKVTFTTTANEGDADRTASVTLTYGEVTKEVTVTQGHLVVDYATLPFEWEGGASADLKALNGVTAYNLGKDYATSNAPYLVKFDETGDYIQVKTNERPGIVSIGVKMLGGANASSITVQESADGENFTELQTLTISGSTNAELNLATTTTFKEASRYVRLYFTKGSNVGVGPISIAQYADIVLEDYTLTIDNPANVTITATYGEEVLTNGDNADIEQGTEITVAVTPAKGYVFKSLTIAGAEEGQTVTPTASTTAEGVWTFNMPTYAVTISATVTEYVAPTGDDYELFSGDLVEGDYIIYYDGKAMNTTVTSDRLQYEEVTPIDNVITTDNAAIVWHIAKNGDDWTIYNAEAEAYAASTGAKNKAQMLKLLYDIDERVLWTVIGEDGTYEFVNKQNTTNEVNANLRNNGAYGFACYATSTGGALSLYKKVEKPVPVTISAAEYATLYYSDKAFVIPEGVTASIVTSTEGGKITFEELSGVIPAGTAVVLNGPQGTYDFLVVNDETVAPASNLLRGFDTPHLTEGGDIYYKLTVKNDKVGFYWGEENGEAFQNGAHKAYLALPAEVAGAKSFYLFSDAVTDGIGAVESTRFNAQGAEIYNLNGQRVSTPQRGIYIVNGKKVLVK